MTTDQPQPRRRFRYSRRALLVVIPLLCVLLAVRIYRTRHLHNVVQAIENVFGEVNFRGDPEAYSISESHELQADTAFVASCLRLVLGKGVGDIREIEFPVSRDSVALLDKLKSLPKLKRLNHNTWYQPDIDRLKTELPNIEFGESQVGGLLAPDTSMGH